MSNFKIQTPHAAVLVWNYVDRIGQDGVELLNATEPMLISTVSIVGLNTSKTKSSPVGQFEIVLAPTRNWVSAITAGSWCCIMMSNEPITKDSITKANSKQVKMLGRIEAVRSDVRIGPDGARQTTYHMTGVDWGYLFNSILYVDNLIASANDPRLQGNAAAVAVRTLLFGDGSTPKSFDVSYNLQALINIWGQGIQNVSQAGQNIGRLASSSIFDFNVPDDVQKFFSFKSTKLNKNLKLIVGKLVSQDLYKDIGEAKGFINPFTLQGTHTLWQALLDNSNPAINEMYCEMKWDENADLSVYNRIRPFAFKGFTKSSKTPGLKSYFQHVKYHDIDDVTVTGINTGTNWRDKFNFVEIKPQFQDFAIFDNWVKQKSQLYDQDAFQREGFRPMIVDTKQFPASKDKGVTNDSLGFKVDFNQLTKWTELLKEWYFDTHRVLNGTITLTGIDDYIPVGDNIRFDAGLINPTPNMNSQTAKDKKNKKVLAHVESVAHTFTVLDNGTRTYSTTIQFVRGILVNDSNEPIGDGILDKKVTDVTAQDDINNLNVVTAADKDDPGPENIKGENK